MKCPQALAETQAEIAERARNLLEIVEGRHRKECKVDSVVARTCTEMECRYPEASRWQSFTTIATAPGRYSDADQSHAE